jgi:hypothetical protein
MLLQAKEARGASRRRRFMRHRAGCDRRSLGGRRRDAGAAVAHAHSAVPARSHRDNGDAHRDNADAHRDSANPYHGAIRTIDLAVLYAESDSVPTASHLAKPKRRRTYLAAAASSCRNCLLDWSDHGPPFR